MKTRLLIAHPSSCLAFCLLGVINGCDSDLSSSIPPWLNDRGMPIEDIASPGQPVILDWSIDSVPSLELGRLTGPPEQQFYDLTGVIHLSNGEVVAANGGSNELLWYDEDGDLRHALGGTGAGPGEFRLLDTLFLAPGDTVLAWDHRLRRFTYFSAEGQMVRTRTVEWEHPGIPEPRGVFDDGAILMASWITLDRRLPVGRIAPDTVSYFLLPADGEGPEYLASVPNLDFFGYRRESGYETIGPLYPHVRSFATVARHYGYLGRTDQFLVAVFDSNGEWIRALRGPEVDRPVSNHDFSEFIDKTVDRQLRESPEHADPAGWRKMLSGRPTRALFPEFERVLVDRKDNLWLMEYKEFWEPHESWMVISPEGEVLGSISGPAGLKITQIGIDFVIGIRSDEFGVQYLAVHPLHRGT